MNKYILLFAAALSIVLSSCEMKEELTSKDPLAKTGMLAVQVTANAPTAMSRAEVSTSSFEVAITGKDDLSDKIYSYLSVSSMPSKVSLPVGSYTVTAHSAGELERKMSAAYYLGEADVDIEDGLTSNKEVTCKMVNSRISIKYSDEFLSLFSSWTITVDDGTDQVLVYTESDLTPADVFWYFKNNTKNISVNIRATTKKGNAVESLAIYNKHNSVEGYENIDNGFFTGGDAITINFSPIENGTSTGKVTSIDIDNNISFDVENETVTLHLKDINISSSDPVTPPSTSDPIVITEPNGTDYLTTGVEYTQEYDEVDDAGIPYYKNYPDDVALHFEVPNGLAHLYVLITGSEDFEFMTGLMGLNAEPYGLDLTDTSDENTAEIAKMDLFTMPVAGATTYDFGFSEGIWRLLPSFVGTQNFKLRAEDSQGNVKEATLVVTINEMQ